MAISKAAQTHLSDFAIHQIPYVDTPALDACDLITLREKSRDDPPSPPPQPPPSPANWTLPPDDDDSMASVGSCTTLGVTAN